MKNDKETTEESKVGELLYLRPKDTLNIVGKMSYKETVHSWNVINLRREIIDIFPQLKEKRGNFGYSMYYNRSSKELKKILDNLEKKDLVPILLLLGRVKE